MHASRSSDYGDGLSGEGWFPVTLDGRFTTAQPIPTKATRFRSTVPRVWRRSGLDETLAEKIEHVPIQEQSVRFHLPQTTEGHEL